MADEWSAEAQEEFAAFTAGWGEEEWRRALLSVRGVLGWFAPTDVVDLIEGIDRVLQDDGT